TSRAEARAVAEATGDAIDLCGLAELAGRPASGLSTGQRRLVELARVIAGDFRLLLLDEPSSGLDGRETERFGEILQTLVPDRGVVALLGPNGAGKTTLLRACSGLLHPTRGSVHVDGVDATRASPHALVALGVCHVPEGRAVFPSLTVAENLKLLGGAGG